MTDFKELFENFSQSGRVEWIGVRPARRETMIAMARVRAISDQGLAGDRYQKKGGTRQVTLIQKEHLEALASFLSQQSISPLLTRRNIVISGLNLQSLKGKQFRLGTTLLEYSGDCHPCSRMEESLGPGGYNAMRGLGGITAKIIEGGEIAIGDLLTPVTKTSVSK